jgi:chromosome segregation ATPase
MTNKSTKKKRPDKKPSTISPAYDSTREQNVLLIDMHKDIKTIAEGHSFIVEKLDRHSEDLAVIKSELDTVKMATMENSHEIKKLKSDVEQLKVGQAKLEQGQQQLAQGQERIEQKIDVITTDHEQRLTKLEAVR